MFNKKNVMRILEEKKETEILVLNTKEGEYPIRNLNDWCLTVKRCEKESLAVINLNFKKSFIEIEYEEKMKREDKWSFDKNYKVMLLYESIVSIRIVEESLYWR